MKSDKQVQLQTLSQQELSQVQGGIGALTIPIPRAQDKWGNTLSHEEYMDRQLAIANGSGQDPHDFYDTGFNGNKPNIYTG